MDELSVLLATLNCASVENMSGTRFRRTQHASCRPFGAEVVRIAWVWLLSFWAAAAAWPQADLSGEWSAIRSEANAGEPEIGEYGGLPLNREGFFRAETWDPEIESLPVWQCRPPSGVLLRLDVPRLRIWRQADPASGELVAFRVGLPRSVSFPIYMDARSRPPTYARHTWGGYSIGVWLGGMLKVHTTHLKDGYYRRNGVPQSDRARFTEFLVRRTFRGEDYLTWVVVADDPIYLAEPLVRSSDYRREPLEDAASSPCAVVKPANGRAGAIPNFLPGANEQLASFADRHRIPPRGAIDGAATMYPEYRTVISEWRGRASTMSD